MPRDVSQRLEDVVEACDKIARYIEGFDAATFAVDTAVVWDAAANKAPPLRAACLRLLA